MGHNLKNSDYSLTPDEISVLVEGVKVPRDKLIIMVFSYTGIRRVELRDLCKNDFKNKKNRLFIRNGKGGISRYVFLPDFLSKKLEIFLRNSTGEYIFTNRQNKKLSLRSINKILEKAGKITGIRNPNPKYNNITPHLLRHSMARNWKNSGGSLEALQKILGHKSFKTTMDLYGTLSLVEIEKNYLKTLENLVSRK